MKAMIPLISVVLLLHVPDAMAIQVSGLYEAEVPVMDQSDRNRRAAISKAMELVLVKLTGDRYVAGRSDLRPLVQQAEGYVLQYRYREDKADLLVDQEDPDIESEDWVLYLSVVFDQTILDQSLRELSVPLWGKERPTTLLWLVVEQDGKREMVSFENGDSFTGNIEDRVAFRGLSVLYPLLDLEDNARLRSGDIWANFQLPVLEASQRYQPDSILTASISSPVPGIWEGHWTAYINDEEYQWSTEGDIIDLVLDEGIDGLADLLASQFVRSSVFAEETLVRIAVADINTAGDYAEVVRYFESLNSVTSVHVERIETGRIILSLNVHGGSLAIAQAISLGRLLEPISEAQGMVYRLLH